MAYLVHNDQCVLMLLAFTKANILEVVSFMSKTDISYIQVSSLLKKRETNIFSFKKMTKN